MSTPGTRIIDLSVPLMNHSLYEISPPSIQYFDHAAAARRQFRANQIRPEDFGPGGFADEIVTANTHTGTHIDAPYHYGPLTGDRPARTIDQVPLEWCYGNGVRLDFRHKKTGELIARSEIQAALTSIHHTVEPGDVVLIWSGVSARLGQEPEFWELHPGMSVEATEWLVDQGVKMLGMDAWGWDLPYHKMFEAYRAGRRDALWPSLMMARRKEFLLLLKLAQLEQLPGPTGFKVAAFPFKLERGSSGWVRAVAIIEG
jgi:kynurenine formamidase